MLSALVAFVVLLGLVSLVICFWLWPKFKHSLQHFLQESIRSKGTAIMGVPVDVSGVYTSFGRIGSFGIKWRQDETKWYLVFSSNFSIGLKVQDLMIYNPGDFVAPSALYIKEARVEIDIG